VRLRWEYRPGSEFFVVYNEDRDTLVRRLSDLAGRALIVKINRLFRPSPTAGHLTRQLKEKS
jgi:hypothetical protein